MAKWMVSAKKADFSRLAEQFQIDPVIARIIRNRDIVDEGDIDRFLHATLTDLHSPSLLCDAERAADLLCDKVIQKKPVRVIGDYDIDGVCSTYILVKSLQYCGAVVDSVIPHRILDGYGLNDELIVQAHGAGVDTIITCDNGIAAFSQIAHAKSLGMTVVVTDHHEVPYQTLDDGSRQEILPEADAVIDPKRKDCAYPFKGICGAVVVYKFIQVFFETMIKRGAFSKGDEKEVLQEFIAFAAFATVGDVMELVDENRILVKYGLKLIEQTGNPGMRALLEVTGLQGKQLTPYHIGFVLGPCINATGRLDTAERALKMFQAESFAKAVTTAGELKAMNDSRKEMTLQKTAQAVSMIEETSLGKDKVLVVYLPDCHESLAGIIAGRLRERYQKPAFVLTRAEEGVKGSGRSIDAYHMYDKMSECRELYTKYGGHKLAAGVSMPEENVDRFRLFLNEHCGLCEEDFIEKIVIDVPMPMAYVTKDFVRQLSVLEPFGTGNPKPVFAQRNIRVLRGHIFGKNNNVGKYRVADGQGHEFEMLYFGDMEKWHKFLIENFGEAHKEALYQSGCKDICIHVIYYPDIVEYRGQEHLQMVMKDFCVGCDK